MLQSPILAEKARAAAAPNTRIHLGASKRLASFANAFGGLESGQWLVTLRGWVLPLPAASPSVRRQVHESQRPSAAQVLLPQSSKELARGPQARPRQRNCILNSTPTHSKKESLLNHPSTTLRESLKTTPLTLFPNSLCFPPPLLLPCPSKLFRPGRWAGRSCALALYLGEAAPRPPPRLSHASHCKI